jgi:trehalose-phosphatase
VVLPSSIPTAMAAFVRQVPRLWLFLDYDGTLDDFAPTPADVLPNPEVIDLVTALVENRRFRVAVVSGRRLDQIMQLLPVPGLLLAGTYGLEMHTPDGRNWTRLAYDSVRPPLDSLKREWSDLLTNYPKFFLEDKGWSLAIHGRYADEEDAGIVLEAAHRLAEQKIPETEYRLLGGHKFLEVAPRVANKGDAVAFILEKFCWVDSVPIYFGDDDKDLEAFPAIKARGGYTCLVGHAEVEGKVDFSLPSPPAVREWLKRLAAGGLAP